MANKAISELPQAQNVNNQDLFVLEQSGIAKKLTAETFITEQGIIDALAEALDGHGGIQSVTLSSVSGRIRTYRITFSDGSATTFQVYDGTSIDRISRTSSSGLDDVYTIFLSDGTTTFFTVHNGADGTVSEAMLNDALKDKAPAVTETTESSAIATFPDGADDMPLHNILAEINPVQNLPYGDPYPAGGSANIWDEETEDGYINSNGALISYANAIRSANYCACVPSTSYYFHAPSEMGGCAIAWYDADKTFIQRDGDRKNSVVTAPSNAYYFKLSLYSYKSSYASYSNNVALNYPASETSYSPYSNICPITGWTGCNVTRTGKNLFDQATVLSGLGFGLQSDGSWLYTGNSYWPAYQQKVWENATGYTGQIAVSLDVKYGTSGKIGLYFKFVYTDGTMESILGSATGDFISTSAVSNASKTVDYIMTNFSYNVADTSTAFKNVQLELGSTATAYEPYQGETVTIDWTSEAGTVYGGTIDVATGLLTVDRAMVDLGTLTWQYITTQGRNYFLAGVATRKNNSAMICSMFPWKGDSKDSQMETREDMTLWGDLNGAAIKIKDSSYTTAADFTTAMSGVQLVYELATPQTYQLTPQQLMTLLGTNNVWADIGNVSVTYPADTKMYIEKLTMPTEDDLVANQAITSGKYFMIGNSLYLALANIASGAQITIGTNAQRVSLADALNTINS